MSFVALSQPFHHGNGEGQGRAKATSGQVESSAVVEWSCAPKISWLFYIGSILPNFVRECFLLDERMVYFFYYILCFDNLHLSIFQYNILDIKGCGLSDMIVRLLLFQCQVANVWQILVMLLGRWLDAIQGCINMYIWYTVFILYLHCIYSLRTQCNNHIPYTDISYITCIYTWYSISTFVSSENAMFWVKFQYIIHYYFFAPSAHLYLISLALFAYT